MRCYYLSMDDQRCAPMSDPHRRAVKRKGCTAEIKDLCCYLCADRAKCETSCSYFNEAEGEGLDLDLPQLSTVRSQTRIHEVFLCPYCGAPYRKPIPGGGFQVKCNYCGAHILVPAHVGEKASQRPNH